jgi:hypothetical protein
MHKCGKNIEALCQNYDPSGTLAVLYAKNTFLEFAKEESV